MSRNQLGARLAPSATDGEPRRLPDGSESQVCRGG